MAKPKQASLNNKNGWTNSRYQPAPPIERPLQFEPYVPARDNPDPSRYEQGTRPIALVGSH